VDDQRVPLHVANHALRAVPVPAGEHTVELRYESTSLRLGIAITLLFYALAAGLALVYLASVRRRSPAAFFVQRGDRGVGMLAERKTS